MDKLKEKIKGYGNDSEIYNILHSCYTAILHKRYTCDNQVIEDIMDDDSMKLLSSIMDERYDSFGTEFVNYMDKYGLDTCIDLYKEDLLNLIEKAIKVNSFVELLELDDCGDPIF